MSGICGIVRLDGQPVKKAEIEKMLDAMRHRGSDAEGVFEDGFVAFGHKALWSTPESVLEKQPILNSKKNLLLVADARIDNREALIKTLRISTMHTITDAEIIVQSYLKWGQKLLDHLIGDFAFVIYDRAEERLFFARDHIGIRPLYYVKTDEVFCFCSEIMPLFTVDGVGKVIDQEMQQRYFDCRVLGLDETFFKEVKRLMPATYGTLKASTLHLERYWFPEKIKIDRSISFKEAAERFRDIFEESVQCRMRTRSPIGCELSGGLDSSSVFSMAVTLKKTSPLIPISMRFGKMACDESSFIDSMLRHTGYEGETIRVDRLDFKEKYALRTYYQRFRDWPRGTFFIAALPTAERLQALGVRVLLTGQGGDHVTRGSGYVMTDYFKQFRWLKIAKELSKWDNPLHTVKSMILRPYIPDALLRFLKKSTRSKPCKHDTIHAKWNRSFAFCDDVHMMTGAVNSFGLDSTASHDMECYNIETRHPFYDKRLIAFSLSLPPEYRIGNGYTKQILRTALAAYLPEKVRMRKDKAEFSEVLEQQLLKHTGSSEFMVQYSNKIFLTQSYTTWKRIHDEKTQ